MKMILSLISMLFVLNAYSQEFTPVNVTTKKFKISSTRNFRSFVGRNLQHCQFKTTLNSKKNAIEMRMGIVGSNFDYFGWDFNIPLADFPLPENYYRIIMSGGNPMALVYDGKTLSLQYIKQETDLKARIYPFSISVDALLTKPSEFTASLAGWEKTYFGKPKKHVTLSCKF